MNLIKAFKAFVKAFLSEGECEHPNVQLHQAPSFCPDCGYNVHVEWLFVQCRTCSAKRIPQKTLLGEIKPLQPYCRHCGQEGFKLVKKPHIEAFELMYATCIKSTDYSETPIYQRPPIQSPFRTTVSLGSGDVFEAEVLRKTEYRGSKSAFKTPPFDWQRNQNPNRYRGSAPDNVVSFLKIG